MSLDNGYYSGDNLEALEQAEVEAYVAVDRGEQHAADSLANTERKLVKADFIYDEATDSFVNIRPTPLAKIIALPQH